MILIVTGERDWPNKQQVWDVLDKILNRYVSPLTLADVTPIGGKLVLRHGVNGGNVDGAANEWGKARGVTIERYPALWSEHGPSAGPRRNGEMAMREPKADQCVAFWSGKMRVRDKREYSGTLNMIQQALGHGIPCTVHPPRAVKPPPP